MKKVFFVFLILFITSGVFAQSNPNEEFRATWVITWEFINRNYTVEQNKALIRSILDKHVEANMNAVLWQVRQGGTAYYQSSYEPWGSYAGGAYPGFDPLAYAVEEAHKRGMEIHAWFNTFHISSTVSGSPAVLHPEWICTNVDGQPMTSYRCASPGMKAVRDYTVNVAMEIVRNYDIDGFHLDYVRWNEYDEDDMEPNKPMIDQVSLLDGEILAKKEVEGRSPKGSKRYYFDSEHPASDGVPEGFSNWDDWRRWSVTQFVEQLHDSIQAAKPWVRLSPAALGKHRSGGTSGWNGYYIVFQDAGKWFREGSIDQLTPMHYHWTTGSGFVGNLISDWKPYIQDGIDAGRLYSVGPGSYILDENDIFSNHVDIVNSVRNVEWADGFQFFSYGSWENNDYWEVANKKFFNQKTRVRNILDVPVNFTVEVALEKIDSLEYNITVTPPDTLSQGYWYVIYRSEDNELNVDEDQIINMTFSKDEYTYTDLFSDAYNFNGTYHYYATVMNRYQNESAVSNSVESDTVSLYLPLPLTPTFLSAENTSETTFVVKCTESDYAEGYAVAYGTNPNALNDTAKSETNIIRVSGINANTPYFFKVLSYNLRGYSDATEQLFAAATTGAPVKVLVVNGFDRSTNTRFDYVKEYAKPITEYGYGFSYVLNEAIYDGYVSLTDYDIVVWFVGDESTADDTFNPNEQNYVKAFLRAGGKLFVSGAEIGWDLEGRTSHATTSDTDFYHNFLKAKYISDAPGDQQGVYYTMEPVADGIFNGLGDLNFDDGSHTSYDVDWPDAIEPQGDAVAGLVFKGAPTPQHIGGIAFEGTFPSGTEAGKLVYLTVPFETFYTESNRIALMDRILDFFAGNVNDINDEDNGITATDYQLMQNYPNPFNPETTIRFAIPEAGNVKLVIYNTLGEKVTELVNTHLSAGYHTYNFNAEKLSSGVYVYRIESGKFTDTKKMMLLK